MFKSPFLRAFTAVATLSSTACDTPESRLARAERDAFDATAAYNDCLIANVYGENGPIEEVCASYIERSDEADEELARARENIQD